MFIDWARDITDTKPEVKHVNLCLRNSGVTCFVLIMAADVTKTQITLLILPKQFSFIHCDNSKLLKSLKLDTYMFHIYNKNQSYCSLLYLYL